MTRSLALAATTAAALAGGSVLLWLVNPFGAPPLTASDAVPVLWSTAALVVVALTHEWAPTLAWSSAIIGSVAGALAVVGLAREVGRLAGGDHTDGATTLASAAAQPALGALVVAALIVPLAVAAGYATIASRGTAPDRRPRVAILTAWLVVVALGTVFIANDLRRTLGTTTDGLPQWAWLLAIALVAAMGLVRDLRPVLARTRARLADQETGRRDAPDGESAPGEDATPGGPHEDGAGVTPLSLLRVLVDELVPGREAGRAEAVESERGRLAADLHAGVLPSLRRALAAAEAGGTVERLAEDLRVAVDEVESLLIARRSVVLEELGLLAGVEWLAERVEEQSAVRVEIEVVGDEGPSGPGSESETIEHGAPGRPPREVERAAFRVAQLALDNVVRHAPRSRARVLVAALARDVRLEVVDDGTGDPPDESAAARSGRQGIVDMRAAARACGAALDVGRGPGGHGTAIRFCWPA